LGILNTGVVLSYVKLIPDGAGGTTTAIRQLPYANPGTATEFFPLHYVGSITFAHISTASPGVAVAASSGTLEFRYVIIPGSVAGGKTTGVGGTNYTAAQVRAMSYERVCQLFHIPM
jgi:hypothetical protein